MKREYAIVHSVEGVNTMAANGWRLEHVYVKYFRDANNNPYPCEFFVIVYEFDQ